MQYLLALVIKPCKKISYFGKDFFNDMCDKGGITANVVETGLISTIVK